MASKVWVFELRDNKTVNKKSVSLTFPRPDDRSLYIITNEKSKCHLLQEPISQKSAEKKSEKKKMEEIFQYGGSTKVVSVTDGTENKWEVRLLLSPSEVNRLSSGFNLTGYLSTCLVSPESHQAYEKLLSGRRKDTAEKICQMIAPFFCLPEGDKLSTQLQGMITTSIKESCKGLCGKEAVMVVGGLVALLAAELAASVVASNTFDYTGEKTEIGEVGEDLKEKIDQMVKAFNIKAQLLVVSHRGKSVFIIFRNPCSDNWASGGRKRIQSGEMFEFGLSHKVFSISGSQSEIQLLQGLQESYDMIAFFHVAAFAEHLLMTQKWRKTLEVLLKDGQNKELINKLSQFAAKFVCSGKCNVEMFLKCFRKEVRKTLSEVKKLQVGGEAISVFGLLVAIMAALKAKAVADKLITKMLPSSDEEAELPVAPESQLSEVDPGSNTGDLPKTQDVVHPEPETIGANLKGNDDIVNEEAATGNKGGISKGLRDIVNEEAATGNKGGISEGLRDIVNEEAATGNKGGISEGLRDIVNEEAATGNKGGISEGLRDIVNEEAATGNKGGISEGLRDIVNEEVATGNKGGISEGLRDIVNEEVATGNKGGISKGLRDIVNEEAATGNKGGISEGLRDIVNEEAATGNKGGISEGLRDGLGGENVDLTKKANSENNETGFSRTSGFGAPETITSSPNPDDIPHLSPTEKHLDEQLDSNNGNLVISSDIKTSEPLGSPVDGLSAEEPQSAEKGQSAEELQGLPEITSTAGTLNTCKDDRQDQDDVNIKNPDLSVGSILSKTFVGHVPDPDTGSGTTYNEDTIGDTMADVPTPTLDRGWSKNTGHQETQILNLSVEKSLTFNSQKYLRTPISQERKELDIDQLGQIPDHLPNVDQGGEGTSNRSVAQSSSFPMPLIILLVALVIALFILPSHWTYFLFTVLALMLGVYLFLGQ